MKRFTITAALVLAASGALAADGKQDARVAGFAEMKTSAEKSDPVAQNNLAVMYATGNGVKQNYAEAAKWYEKAGEQGYPVAQHNLGTLYENGMGVPRDLHAAKVWYELAAEQGDTWAQLSLGQLLVSQKVDPVRAYVWLYLASLGQDADVKQQAGAELNKIGGKLSSAQLSEATDIIRAWRPRR